MKTIDLKINNLYLCFSEGEFSFDAKKKFKEYGVDDNNEIDLKKVAKCLSSDIEMENDLVYNILKQQDTENKGKINISQFLKALDDINEAITDTSSTESETNDSSEQ